MPSLGHTIQNEEFLEIVKIGGAWSYTRRGYLLKRYGFITGLQ
jgi:hypothetical protein